MSVYINYNGKQLEEKLVSISASNRSFRYGDGFFETLQLKDGKLLNSALHQQRIIDSLTLLQFDLPSFFTVEKLFKEVGELSKKNKHNDSARVRITFFRGDGGLYDPINNVVNYIIQTYALSSTIIKLNDNGLVMGFYLNATKAMDDFSHIKSNSFLPYVMASLWAKKNQLNDAILLNTNNTVADTTIANIFIVKDNTVLTPGLQDGCIAGVTRALLLKSCSYIQQQSITMKDVLQADEVFVTNAIKGIQWVKQIGNTVYSLGNKTLEVCKLFQSIQNK